MFSRAKSYSRRYWSREPITTPLMFMLELSGQIITPDKFSYHTCVIVSAAARGSILVGGDAQSVQTKSAVPRRGRAKFFSKNPEKFYPQNFLMTFFSHRKNTHTQKIASAARRQNISGAPITKRRRGRLQIHGGAR